MMNVQQNEFAARIARIQHASGRSVSTVYTGDQKAQTRVRLTRETRKQRELQAAIMAPEESAKSVTGGLLPVPLAFLIGCMALILWKAADFHLTTIQGNFGNPVRTMALTTAIATGLAFMMCQTIGLIKPMQMLAAFLGVVAMVLGMHNLVHVAPEQFAELFSQSWVDQIIASTPANSVMVAGVLYPFG